MSDEGTRALAEVLDGIRLGGDPGDAEAIAAALARRGFYIREFEFSRRQRQAEEIKKLRAEHKAAALADAVPYSGAITDCQAAVHESGRGVGFHRCNNRARFVVGRLEAKEKGDGRLAVCRTHAEDTTSWRYQKHWSYERSADEVVEMEYQIGEGSGAEAPPPSNG